MTSPKQSYRKIPLSKGMTALVSTEDYEVLAQYDWKALWNGHGRWYAARYEKISGKQQTILMHRQILGLTKGDKRQADHIKPKRSLDNRRSNLRIATHSENQHNKPISKNNTSGYKGVTYHKHVHKWMAQIVVGRKYIYLGYFDTARAASNAWRKAAIKYHGVFAHL